MFGNAFGQNATNPQQQSSGFGGFGANNTTNTGFGQPASTGFGSNNAGGSLFGGNSTNTNTGFGGFGAPASNATTFGATQNRSGFGTGTTSGGGLFGGNNTATAGPSSGFGGFGTNSTSNTGSIFGGAAPKPAFGASNTAGSSLFGGNSTGNAFGTSNNSVNTTGFGGGGLGAALGTNTTDCQGTGSTPFQAYQEKEGASNTTNHFQSISFMPPYKNFSFEELRLADYNQGRRFGNGSGQPGAFGFPALGGQTSNTTTNPFGTQTNNSSLFGGNQTSNAFGGGSNTNTLFGAKPAGGGMFGTSNTATSQPTNSMFGGTTNSAPAFGGFGSSTAQQQEQPKAGGFSFGTNTNTAGGFGANSSGFGTNNATNTTGGGLFGTSNQNNAPFGGGQQQQPASNPFGSGFGTNQNQNQASAPAFGGFGQNQQAKPGGLFGTTPNTNTNTGSSPFGTNNQNSQQQPASNSIFGTNNNQQQPAGNNLFGKAPSTTTNLFGTNNSSNSTNTASNPFGGFGTNNNTNQGQQNPEALFGLNSQQQQKPASTLFNTGGSSNPFGTSNNNQQQPAGNSLFGASNNNQPQPQGGFFGNNSTNFSNSLGNTQQQNQLLPPQTLQASLLDSNAWGSSSIFSGLPPPPTQNVGPLATPISAAKSKKVNAIHPHYKINPYQSQSRLVTPRRGYGFTYSTYGTPSSVSSNVSTPGGFTSSLLHGSVGRSLGKSLSTSNLRRTFDSDGDSLLSPGAFSAGSSRYLGAGSLKKLTIDRSLRTDLFSNEAVAALPSPDKSDQSKQPGILKKKVSFDTNTVGGNKNNQDGVQADGLSSGDINNNATPSAQELGYSRSSRTNGSRSSAPKPNGVASPPEMEQVKGNELAIVHEDEYPESANAGDTRPPPRADQNDPQPGSYYMRPSREELDKMAQEQRSKVTNFEIGREGCGRIIFNQPVDLNQVKLDDIFDKIAVFTLRSLTIYPDSTKKPPRGKGLNVPATIHLENSWPRNKDRKTPSHEFNGPRFNKHVERLRRVVGTEFVRYEKETGIWVFKVPHFTTYGFDYDDDASEGESLHTSTMGEVPSTPTPKSRKTRDQAPSSNLTSLQNSTTSTDVPSYISSSPEDTFEFRKKKQLPGAFDDVPALYDDHDMDDTQHDEHTFLDDRLAASPSDSGDDEPSDIQDANVDPEDLSVLVQDDDVDMVGAFPRVASDSIQPKSILKPSWQSFDGAGTPRALKLSANDAWADQLQRTISPRKQNREALRRSQAYILTDSHSGHKEEAKAKYGGEKDIATSIDLMNSIFGKEQLRKSQREAKQPSKGKGFEWPYPKHSKSNDGNDMDQTERSFHESYKPSWGPGSILMYSKPSQLGRSVSKSSQTGAVELVETGTLSSDGREIALAKLVAPRDTVPESLRKQRIRTEVKLDGEVPFAKVLQLSFKELASSVQDDFHREKAIWELAAILFDELEEDAYAGVPTGEASAFEYRVRKDQFSIFWEHACQTNALDAVPAASNAEERALAYLSANKIVEACDALVQGKNFRLSLLVSQIGGDETMREDMATQIHEWRELNVLSEMTEPIRALYELLAGNTCICEGKKGPLEDRARTFAISDRFKLDWKRAFGLRLWYAIQAADPIEAAVKKFADDLDSDERKKPLPWFLEENAPREWQDPDPNSRQDLLWGCLLLYASSKGAIRAPPLATMVSPQNATGNPLNARLSFQLYHALALRFPQTDDSKADQLAWDFATQLESTGEWLWAIYAVLHLTNQKQRRLAIEALLAPHTSNIQEAEFETLTNEFKIPASWIWSAKALLARSKKDPVEEVQCLIRSGDWEEAHDVLRRTVAPQAVIEQDYTTLQPLLEAFDQRRKVIKWEDAGGIYEEFIWLVQDMYPSEEDKVETIAELLESLPAMLERQTEFVQRVAAKEMMRVVVEMGVAKKNQGVKEAEKLQLPEPDNAYLKESFALSSQYYNAIMAGGN